MFEQPPGLTEKEVASQRAQYGLNVLPEKKPPSDFLIFVSQLKNPLIYILILAGTVTLFLQHYPDTAIIFVSIFVNTILGFVQEKKANQAFSALKSFVTHTTEVIRDNQRQKIDVSTIVPGDIVILNQGAKVPADGELLFVNRCYFEEAIITGESTAVSKNPGDTVFMGSTISAGQALMKVERIGSQTRIGGIATSIQEFDEDTPLKRQLAHLSKKLVVLVLCLTMAVLVIGLLRGVGLLELFSTSVALAVSSIPEGLAVSLTVILAIGMQRLLKRKGLVKKLSSAETLGGVTTICIDKTGTLTQGKMKVVQHFGSQQDLSRQVVLANDLDDPVVLAAYAWGQEFVDPSITDFHKRLDSIPFSSQQKYFMSLHKESDTKNIIFVNGAPDVLLAWTTLGKAQKEAIIDQINDLTNQGKRVIGFARKKVAQTKIHLDSSDAKGDLEWVGLLAFFDPVRVSVKEALALAQKAGIKLIVITGDYPNTTQFVLAEIGIELAADQIMVGSELEQTSVSELSERIKTVQLFARTSPDQKYSIVKALQQNGEVVAMMGDGVNDAPAIHTADIGIAVNEASDVAKESADLILLDSNFSTIIAAIEEGRVIFDNMRKIILYLLCDAFAEIFVVISSIILGLPLPITAVQIIWINLISDGFPSLALTIDLKNPNTMSQPPRSPQEKLVSKWMMSLIAIVSLVAGSVALLAYVLTLTVTNDAVLARSLCFAILGLNSLTYVFSVRTLTTPFWRVNAFANKWLVAAVGMGFILQLVPFMHPATRDFFGVTTLPLSYWLLAMCLSVAVFFTVEIFKFVVNHLALRHTSR